MTLRAIDVPASVEELQRALSDMGDLEKWTPALTESQKVLSRLAGGREIPRLSDNSGAYYRHYMRSESTLTDVFFAKDAVLFITTDSGALMVSGVWGPRTGQPARIEQTFQQGIIIGAVGRIDRSDLLDLVSTFCDDLEAALKRSVNTHRFQELEFKWVEMPRVSNRLRTLMENLRSEAGRQPRFSSAELDETQLPAVELMADRPVRTLLRELNEAVFAREDDVLMRRDTQEVQDLLVRLQSAGLLISEYVLRCRKTSGQLTRVPSEEAINTPTVAELRCANCNRRFAEELLSKGFGVTNLGQSLLKGSQWLTIWVTVRLVALGVPIESILWNVEASGEEVDIIVDFVDRLWIYELKDRDFGAGDAYPFNYRKARYHADRAVIITTEKVLSDARRVFADLGREAPGGSEGEPSYIEGLATVEESMRVLFEKASADIAARVLTIPSVASGFDIRRALLDNVSRIDVRPF